MWDKIKQLFGCSNTPKVDEEGYTLVCNRRNVEVWERETNEDSVEQLDDFYIRPSRHTIPYSWTSPMQEMATLFLRDPSGWVKVVKESKLEVKRGRDGGDAKFDGYCFTENTSYIHLNTGVYFSTSNAEGTFEGRRTTYSSNIGCTERELTVVYKFVWDVLATVRTKKRGLNTERASNTKKRNTTKKINDYLKTL